jgi:glycosyltransferase involved in cell wall biosynthesis
LSVAIAFVNAPEGESGIADYSRRLAAALREAGVDARETPVASWELGEPGAGRLPEGLGEFDLVALQYNPFSYGRRGFAPWLVRAASRLKRGPVRLALNVHEPWVPIVGPRSLLMGTWQRAQLLTLLRLAGLAFASTEAWAAMLGRAVRRPVIHLPVGSNLPDERRARAAERKRLGLDDAELVVAAFGTDHKSRPIEAVAAAANAVAATAGGGVLLNLGRASPEPPGLDERLRVVAPGVLPPDRVARLLSAADLFVAPFIDGVSSRRTTLIAALQHGLPVVGTEGELTCGWLRDAVQAIRLVPVGRPGGLSAAAAELAGDAEARSRLGEEGRRLYESRFDWPRIAAGFLEATA